MRFFSLSIFLSIIQVIRLFVRHNLTISLFTHRCPGKAARKKAEPVSFFILFPLFAAIQLRNHILKTPTYGIVYLKYTENPEWIQNNS